MQQEIPLSSPICDEPYEAPPQDAGEHPATALRRLITVPPRPWTGAKLGKCLVNVAEMIRLYGGEAVCGWAIDYGPLRLSGWYPPPLYTRWLNHVVWRDPQGAMWEVSPHLALHGPQEMPFQATQFLIDAAATFAVSGDEDWNARPCRYVALRPEGEEVVARLGQAQAAVTEDARIHWIKEALAALTTAGFNPREWKVETVAERTGTIWLIAD